MAIHRAMVRGRGETSRLLTLVGGEQFTRGFYVNDLAREVTAKAINANYRGKYPRLVQVKKAFDPTNLFRLNANVQVGA